MKKLIYSFITTAICWSGGADAVQTGVHGMLLFGDQSTYLSHLPMFHAPHDYQVLLQVSLQNTPGSQTVEIYNASKTNSDEFFTLVPEVMDLTEIINGIKTTFTATIYRGHFERGGMELGLVRIRVEKLLFSAKLNGQGWPMNNHFLVFGGKGEYFAIHEIQGVPSYDAILAVDQPYHLVSPVCTKRECPQPRVRIPDSHLPLTLTAYSVSGGSPRVGDKLGEASGPLVDIERVVYLEDADLAE